MNTKGILWTACAALALTTLASDPATWKRFNYPDSVRNWPQLKGTMLGLTTEREFMDLRNMGATLVRYQMAANWKQFVSAAEANKTNAVLEYEKWMKGKLDHLETMLKWSRQYGIKICIDLHTHIGGFTDEEHNSLMIFVEKKYEDVFVETWRGIARRFKGNTDAIYGYDLINEPIDRENKLTKTSWRAVMCRTVEAVREIDPETPIIIEPNCHASPRGFDVKNPYGLKGIDPLPYDNLIYSVHVYQPLAFTHQGLFKKKEDYKPQPYPSANATLDPNRKRYPGDVDKDAHAHEVWNKEFLRREIQSVRDFQLRTGARIFVGEFSAAAYAPGAAQYLEDLCSLFREYGWDWTYHAFRESTCWSFEHEGPSFYELQSAKTTTPRKALLEKYMRDGTPSPFAAQTKR